MFRLHLIDFLHRGEDLKIKTKMSRLKKKLFIGANITERLFTCSVVCSLSAALALPEEMKKPIQQGILTNRWCFLLCFLPSVPLLSSPIVLLPDNITFTLLLPLLPPVTPHEILPCRALTCTALCISLTSEAHKHTESKVRKKVAML